jgi:iron complex outermembrane recepter protein
MGVMRQLRSVSVCALAIAVASQAASGARKDPKRPQTSAPPPVDLASHSGKREPSEEATIVVTGSRIPRTNLTAVSPVTMIKSDEVKLEGATLVEELLNQLPQVTPDQGAFISNGSFGTSTVVLRGLGSARTLVLINGRRVGPDDPQFPVADLNLVPSFLIQRVEVLTGGASSVYGSDAVAGVVNFILDTKIEGLRIDGQTSVFQHDNNTHSGIIPLLQESGDPYPHGNTVDGARQDINVAYGQSLLGNRAHVTVYAGYRTLDGLTQDSRDYSACTITPAFGDPNSLFCGGSAASYPGNFIAYGLNERFQIGPDRTFVPGRSFYNYAPVNFYQRPDRRYTAGGFADVEISKELKPYIEAMWMDDHSLAQIAPSADFGNTGNINCDNPLLSDQQRSKICVNGNFVGQQTVFDDNGNIIQILGSPRPFIDPLTGNTYFRAKLRIQRRGVESGPRQDDLRHKYLRIVGGMKGDIAPGVTYDASYLFGRAKMSDAHLNDFSTSRLAKALDVVTDPATGKPVCRSLLTGDDPNCVPWDVFSLGGVTPDATAYLDVPSFESGTTTERIANFNSTLDFGAWGIQSPWSDESPGANIGAEYRKDSLDFEPDALAQSGDLAGLPDPILPIHGGYTVKELFAEARIPLISGRFIDELAFEGGYRKSWYKAGQSGNTSDAYKVALDLTAVRGLRLRASQQRAVRAPNIIELFYPEVPDSLDFDLCAGIHPQATVAQCQKTGVTAAQYGQILALPPQSGFASYNAITGGNPNLAPEKATTRTIGVVLQPRFIPGFNATVDWWDIKLRGAIEVIGADTIMQTCIDTGDPSFCGRIHRDSEGSLWLSPQGYVDNRVANIGSLETIGIDFGADYTHGLGRFGTANLEFRGTKVNKWTVSNGGLAKPFDCAGLYGVQCGTPTPSWRHTLRLTWESRSGMALSLHWRHTGAMTLADVAFATPPDQTFFADSDRHLPAIDYFDVTALFKVGRDYSFRLGVNNIFDREPPLVTGGDACWSGCNGNTYPQWYDPLGRFFFAGVTMNLNQHF